ncbi:MAG: hypothetical protein EOM80_12255 [Erysipelotrichia bacterium]|nr:hypothetical protein [Erysipelotrichia bacterium]
MELVCTAGLTREGKWIRLYPAPFRMLETEGRYKKFQWITTEIFKNTEDPRPESFKIYDFNKILPGEEIPPDSTGEWHARRKLVLKQVYTSKNEIIAKAKSMEMSLCTFKPKEILDFEFEPVEREWDEKKLAEIEAQNRQGDLFAQDKNPFEVVKKLPYKFFFRFLDEDNIESRLMIEDWEIGALFWNCLARKKNEEEAIADVKNKYLEDFAKTKDLYLFLGTTREHHSISRNPFVIVGVFPPKPVIQPLLF